MASALIVESFSMKNCHPRLPSGVCAPSLAPMPCRYSVASGSSMMTFWSRICLVTIAPSWYSSDLVIEADEGLPRSGRSPPPALKPG